MFVQGLGHKTQVPIQAVKKTSLGSKPKAAKSDSVEISFSSPDTDRNLLLKKIKGQIKTGFYNSESVIEDLSHGFAKALDQSF